jgi:proton-translocating NADH-quinone oxidoreductase chain N
MLTSPFFWLIALPLLLSPLIYLVGRFEALGSARRARPARLPIARWLAVLTLLATWAPYCLAALELGRSGEMTLMIQSIALRLDGLSLLLAGVALGLATLVAIFSIHYMAGERDEEKYYAMLVAMTGVMIGLGCAADLFNLWVWFEAMAVSSYLLVVFYDEQPASLEAGVKYVVQSAAGSVLVLIAIALVFSQTGVLDLEAIRQKVSASPLFLAAGALFLAGFGVKAALVPLHTWLPDAHTQAPSGISAMLSGVVIEAGLVAMLRALGPLSGDAGQATPAATWGGLLIAAGCANMLLGNLMALRQKQVKRLLAYSSLSHVGYMLLGLGVALYAGQSAGAQGSAFHLLTHGMMKGLAFLAAGALLHAIGTAAGSHASTPLTIKNLDGASRRYPLAALAFSVAVLGLGGLPPLAGFMSKWQIFVGGFSTQNLLISLLVIFAALNSVLSLAYYAPLVNAVYRRQASPAMEQGAPIPALMNLPVLLLAVLVILLGLWPNLVQWLTVPAGQAILAAFGG